MIFPDPVSRLNGYDKYNNFKLIQFIDISISLNTIQSKLNMYDIFFDLM